MSETLTMPLNKNLTVAKLKIMIKENTGIMPYCQTITKNGKILDFNHTLTKADCNLEFSHINSQYLWAQSKDFSVNNEKATWNCQISNYHFRQKYNNCIWMPKTVLNEGRHQMSFQLFNPAFIGHLCGLIHQRSLDNVAINKEEDGWFLCTASDNHNLVGHSSGQMGKFRYLNNLKDNNNIVTMEADLDKKTLQFWFNGTKVKSYFNNVEGPVVWAASVYGPQSAVKVIETPVVESVTQRISKKIGKFKLW